MLTRLRAAMRPEADTVRRATAEVRGAALAVLATAARVQERLGGASADDDGTTPPAGDVRARLERAHQLLGDLERRPIAYEGPAPAGAPVSGWQVPAVAAARAWLDDAHDAAVRVLPRSWHVD